jgi:hypothetical protein
MTFGIWLQIAKHYRRSVRLGRPVWCNRSPFTLCIAFVIATSCCVLARADELAAAVQVATGEEFTPIVPVADVAAMTVEAASASAMPTGGFDSAIIGPYHCAAPLKHLSAPTYYYSLPHTSSRAALEQYPRCCNLFCFRSDTNHCRYALVADNASGHNYVRRLGSGATCHWSLPVPAALGAVAPGSAAVVPVSHSSNSLADHHDVS